MESEEELDLTLSLRCGSSKETPTSFLPLVSPFQTNLSLMEIQKYCSNINPNPSSASASSDHSVTPPNAPAKAPKKGRSLGSSRRISRGKGTSKAITAPFPWAKNQRATVHSQQYLLEKNVDTIIGKVYCKSCQHEFELGLNLEEKLDGLCEFFRKEKNKWHKRAPRVWMSPVCPKCPLCERESSTRPVIAENKKEINWLFLLLSQMLGYCTLEHLKYFCKHNEVHRTGAKDRLLYDTYKTLVNQLLPDYLSDS
ncbi:hypothetical protein LR48_Vigan04g245500 [Vigna angularis]|uniref:DUF7086 domain-containing protein n=2 Tax=Phaseolus angularis TaxID=3914 RepID=A0A0L9UI63_PHAAN|nr:uncharacterized protein LOC128196329 [Vigna angularis]KOM42257.1 hypothetical protein LR48_Vigan04g245500 [Vigna angularis]